LRAYYAAAVLTVVLLVSAVALLGPLAAPAGAEPASVVSNGRREPPKIALTFDDNFNPNRSLATIKALSDRKAEATFFVVGSYVTAYPALTKAIAAAGFEVGDHSASHPVLTNLSHSAKLREIGAGTDAFRAATGRRTVPLHRPPYGAWNSSVARAAGERGFSHVVLWDVDTNDWRGHSAATIVNHVLTHARNGSIVLMHVGAPHTYEAIPGIVDGLRARGFELVTVSELLKGDRRFLDVTTATPGNTAIMQMIDWGLMSGYDKNYFGPHDPMTRAQFAKVAALAAGLHTEAIDNAAHPTFTDVPLRYENGVPVPYPFDFIEEAAAAGIIQGRTTAQGNVFAPAEPITRVQLALMLARMARELKGYVPPEGGLPPAPPDVPSYAREEVAFVQALGLMHGYGDGTFRPTEKAKRAHVAVVVSRYRLLE
jgi:peptidoglycan/xylan/chitin deacetylase (PgdA/CDA1 family)